MIEELVCPVDHSKLRATNEFARFYPMSGNRIETKIYYCHKCKREYVIIDDRKDIADINYYNKKLYNLCAYNVMEALCREKNMSVKKTGPITKNIRIRSIKPQRTTGSTPSYRPPLSKPYYTKSTINENVERENVCTNCGEESTFAGTALCWNCYKEMMASKYE
jgi:uncharacterized protein YbaR (Trm112 family)